MTGDNRVLTGERGRRQVASLVRQAVDSLAGLGLPERFTLPELCRRVEEHRARPVHLISRELPALAPHGLWVAGEHADYVFYDCTVGLVRQHQIIGHELGHLLFDDTATPHAVRQRSGYDVLAERRAEMFGSVVVQRTGSWARLPDERTGAGRPGAVGTARLVAALEGSPRR